MNDETLRGDARLAVVDDAGLNSDLHCLGEVGRLHDDERVAAAQLEDDLLNALRRAAGHARPRRLAASECGCPDPIVFYDALHLLGCDQQRLELAGIEPALDKRLLDGQRTLRHIRGVLEQSDISRHERGRGEAEHLPEGKVPGHDRQHRPDRLVADE